MAPSESDKSHYQSKLLAQEEWTAVANELLGVAELIKPRALETWASKGHGPINFQLLAIYFMLTSYAIENLLKAVIVQKKKGLFEEELAKKAQLPGRLKSHDLVALAKEADMSSIFPAEEDILRRLTKCAVWYGRYPVPSSYKDYKSVMFSDGERHIVSGFSSTDVQRIKKIIDEIQKLLSKANS